MQWPWIVAMFTTAVLVQGQSQYEVQVQGPIDFEYRDEFVNTLFNGSCCSPNQVGSVCNISCDNRIILCFRESQHPDSDTNLAVCPLGRMVFTPPTMNTDIITFNATIAATTTTYPGIYQILLGIIALPGGGEVDSSRLFTLVRSIRDRNSQLTTQDFGLTRTMLSTGGVRVVCKEGYFGPDCGCTPQDDSTGHFTCDENGIIVCLPGYQNNATNCVEEGATPKSTTDPEITFTINPSSENDGDIVPIVAGGVAGGLVVLLLILIVNIVLVIVVIKVKYTKHYQSNKQESHTEEDIAMRANPVYEIKRFGQSEPGEQNDYYETVQ